MFYWLLILGIIIMLKIFTEDLLLDNTIYQNPLCGRYASKEMQHIFSNEVKFQTWRKLWIALAEAEKELGLGITNEQIEELKSHSLDINYEVASEQEKKVRHDVMSHVYAYGQQCPGAAGIIHLGATSCYVGDNTDIIVMKTAMLQIKKLLVNLINELKGFAKRYESQPTLAYTHFQAAQPTTLGKRSTLWLYDLIMDLEQLDFQIEHIRLRGCKGTTGTCASFMTLFNKDHDKVKELEKIIARKMGFEKCYPVTGQTYSRKVDYNILSVLSGIAQSAHKFSNDIRLLSHLKEVDEPFEEKQIGSSAMAYKRNPMRSERIASLSRYVIVDSLNPAITASVQWFERTLDDSANKRISIPEAFLAVDAILTLYINIVKGMKVYPRVMEKHLDTELPFMATESIIMLGVKKGGNRQVLHEAIRQHSVKVAEQVKLYGNENDLIDRILADPVFNITKEEIDSIMNYENFIGRAPQQTEEFIADYVDPVIEENKNLLGINAEVNV